MSKKRVLIHSNSHSAFTGFGKNCKNILKHLYATGKYEVYELANGVVWNDETKKVPWGFHGSLPNDAKLLANIQNDPVLSRKASYGLLSIDNAIEKIRPDIYLGIEDIWAFPDTVKKPWWNKINCMIWTTLDSLPILPEAISLAPNIKHYYCWAKFAETAMKKIGIDMKTLHGSIDCSHFFRKSDSERAEIRKKHGIDQDSFIIGYVFRNQLRKTVSDLIIGFRLFKEKYPESFGKLLLHTNFSEGWDIPRLLSENNVDPSDVLTTYHCPHCKNYRVMPFSGNGHKCHFCGKDNAFSTTSVVNGVSETQLNEVYNMMDVYAHPFTSGGQEIPIQEAKLTELITLVTNYSCGEEMCTPESGGFPLLWSPYREIGTQFIKASTNPIDVFKKISMVYEMPKEKAAELGSVARKYIIDNYSSESVGKKLEQIFDEMPLIEEDYQIYPDKPNPNYIHQKQYPSDVDFLKDIYKNILGISVSDNDDGLLHWIRKLRSGATAKGVVDYFRKTAKQELDQKFSPTVEDLVDINDPAPRIALVVPSDVYISLVSSYFIKPLKDKYKDHKLYVFADKKIHPMFLPYMDYIEKLCPLTPNCDNILFMEGTGKNKGFFDVCLVIENGLLNLSSYSHNAKDGI